MRTLKGLSKLILPLLAAPLLLLTVVSGQAADAKLLSNTRSKTTDFLRKKDYTGLETLVASIKAKGYQIEDTKPELSAFYEAFVVPDTAKEEAWLKRREALEEWLAGVPESSAARTALADWWTSFAWKARGRGFANTVTPDGWKNMEERLEKAGQILVSIEPDSVDDPEYFRLWLTVALGQGWRPSQMNRYFEAGIAAGKNYYPLYSSKGYFLLPKWHGGEDDLEVFAASAADSFPGDQGDLLYANLMQMKAEDFGEKFFQNSTADYERMKKGAAFGMKSEDEHTRYRAKHLLCHFAARKGDDATASRLFLEIGPYFNASYFGRMRDFIECRNRSTAGARIAKARNLEIAGNLAEAEEYLASFTADPATNRWLELFYFRQGMKEKYTARKPDIQALLEMEIAKASPDHLADLSRTAHILGEWSVAEAAASRFDSMRPWNLSGRATLFFCAARSGDTARSEALMKSLLEYKSDRPAYKNAQALLSGQKEWAEVAGDFKANDGYNQQAALTVVAAYAAQGKRAHARKIAEAMLDLCEASPVYYTLFEACLYGSLAPLLEPKSPRDGK
jgi:hypothetical protein